jgi:predicted transcriptional regulator
VANLDPIEFTAEVVAAFISRNSVPTSEVPALIESVHAAFTGSATPDVQAAAEPKAPAVSIRKSITPDYLICLDDGKRFKSLRRHLAKLGMTPEQYRAKWGLPLSYPMVASNYAALRSAMAKDIGLGQTRKTPEVDPPPAAPRRKPGRPRKA